MTFDGTGGNDSIIGGSAADTISGLAGDDFLSGAGGNDRVLGGDGADTLVGGAGNDLLDGGSGWWIDAVQFQGDGAPAGAIANLKLGTATDGFGGHDTLVGIENLLGGEHNDDLTGDDAVNYLDGFGGDDTVHGGGGNDILAGDAGNDSIEGDAGADTIFGGIGDDVLRGGLNDDILLGANGHDTLDGGSQDWCDIADYYEAPFAVVVNLALGVSQDDGFGGSDVLISIEGVYGSSFDDSITGDAGNNFFFASTGDDTLTGGLGNDTLNGAGGNDLAVFSGNASSYTITTDAVTGEVTVSGPDGVDVLNSVERIQFGGVLWTPTPEGTPQADTLAGGDGADTIHGHEGNDSVSGAGGADSLFGDEGDDTLNGGAGNDTLEGGTGNDLAVFSGAASLYTITTDPVTGQVTVSGADGTDVLHGIEHLQFDGVTWVPPPDGTLADDTVTGGDNADSIHGYTGNDSLLGMGGADKLYGDEGNDTIDGGTGADTMTGGVGNDLYRVDSAADQVVEASGGGTDTVQATVSFTLPAQVENLVLLGSADLHGTGNATGNAITGNSGANVFTGLAGNDTIDGGAGIDLAIYSAQHSHYSVHGDGTGFTVDGSQAAEGIDSLTGIERVQFSDTHLALDLDGNAGIAARILGAVAGADWIGAKGASLVGQALTLLDGGMSYQSLMQAALDMRLGSNATHEDVVNLLYTNIANAPPDAATLAHFTGLLDDHTYTVVGLAMLAADSDYNANNIDLTGLSATGLEFN